MYLSTALPSKHYQNNEVNSICENSIIISLGMFEDSFNSESLFMMLFKHLV